MQSLCRGSENDHTDAKLAYARSSLQIISFNESTHDDASAELARLGARRASDTGAGKLNGITLGNLASLLFRSGHPRASSLGTRTHRKCRFPERRFKPRAYQR